MTTHRVGHPPEIKRQLERVLPGRERTLIVRVTPGACGRVAVIISLEWPLPVPGQAPDVGGTGFEAGRVDRCLVDHADVIPLG